MAKRNNSTSDGQKTFRRYYNGEMSHEEQFCFEAELDSDPFLVEAYEGFQQLMADGVAIEAATAELHQKLKEVIPAAQPRSPLVWLYGTAAVVVLGLLISWLIAPKPVLQEKLQVVYIPKTDTIPKAAALTPAIEHQPDAAPVASLIPDSIRGRVVDDHGLPLPGVTVLQAGIPVTSTDTAGEFSLRQPASDSLQLMYIGFQPQSVPIDGPDLGTMILTEDTRDLNEVIVVGYHSVVQPVTASGTDPTPTSGWEDYSDYLENATQSAGLDGQVTVTFTVLEHGGLTGFMVQGEASLQKEVIRIIQEGPPWTAASQHQAAVARPVTLRLQFKK